MKSITISKINLQVLFYTRFFLRHTYFFVLFHFFFSLFFGKVILQKNCRNRQTSSILSQMIVWTMFGAKIWRWISKWNFNFFTWNESWRCNLTKFSAVYMQSQADEITHKDVICNVVNYLTHFMENKENYLQTRSWINKIIIWPNNDAKIKDMRNLPKTIFQ